MDELKHLFPKNTAATEQYTYSRSIPPTDFKVPPRDGRVKHSNRLIKDIRTATKAFQEELRGLPKRKSPEGMALDFCSDPGFKLRLQSLDIRRSGIELRNARTLNGVMYATVFVPEGKVGIFIRIFEAYAKKNTETGKPRNKFLAESISKIRLASLRSFWTDAGEFPSNTKELLWWEVWLRENSDNSKGTKGTVLRNCISDMIMQLCRAVPISH